MAEDHAAFFLAGGGSAAQASMWSTNASTAGTGETDDGAQWPPHPPAVQFVTRSQCDDEMHDGVLELENEDVPDYLDGCYWNGSCYVKVEEYKSTTTSVAAGCEDPFWSSLLGPAMDVQDSGAAPLTDIIQVGRPQTDDHNAWGVSDIAEPLGWRPLPQTVPATAPQQYWQQWLGHGLGQGQGLVQGLGHDDVPVSDSRLMAESGVLSMNLAEDSGKGDGASAYDFGPHTTAPPA